MLRYALEVRVEHPGRERFAELERTGCGASTHDQAGEELRVVGGGEQGGRCSDVRADDVRTAKPGLRDQAAEEVPHLPWRQQVVAALGTAEAGQVDGEQPGVCGQRPPDGDEGVETLRPGAGQQDGGSMRAAAVGVPDPDTIDGEEARLDGFRGGGHGLPVSLASSGGWHHSRVALLAARHARVRHWSGRWPGRPRSGRQFHPQARTSRPRVDPGVSLV